MPGLLLCEIYYIHRSVLTREGGGATDSWYAATVHIIYISTLLNRIGAEKPQQKTEARLLGLLGSFIQNLPRSVAELLHGYFPILPTDRD